MAKSFIKFEPKRGQIDFTHARYTPVLNCVVQRGGKILIVKRSPGMNLYQNYWSGISGFLDDWRSVSEKAEQELKEEVGIDRKSIDSIKQGTVFEQEEPKYEKTWIVHPVLVKIRKCEVVLDWEAKEYKWIKPNEAKNFKLVPGFDRVIKTFFKLS